MNDEAGVSTEPDRETVATSTEEYESRRKPTVRIRRFFRKGGLYIAGALITAIIGTYITNYSSRANLKVFLTSVSIDSPTLDSLMFERALREQQGLYGYGSKFTRNARLVEISNDSDWLPSLEGGTFDSYLTTVYQVRRRAGNASEQIQALRNGLVKWPKVVTELNLEIVYGILRDHSDAVEATMFGEIRTNRPVFSGSPPALDNKKAFYAVNTDDDGDIYVDDDKRRIPILWSEACDGDGDKKKEQCHQAALRLANSIAYFVADDLAQLKNLLDRTIMDLSHLSEASRESEIEIERFSYWRVTVTLTNNGKDPIAVSPWATMLVQPPAENKPNNSNPLVPRTQEMKTPPITIPVQIVELRTIKVGGDEHVEKEIDYEQPSQAPTIIEGGKAVSITMRSTERISSSDAGQDALRAFHGERASVTLSLLPLTSLTGSGNAVRSVLSQAIEFKDLGITRQ